MLYPHYATNQEVAGSSPAGRANPFGINHFQCRVRGPIRYAAKFVLKQAKLFILKRLPARFWATSPGE